MLLHEIVLQKSSAQKNLNWSLLIFKIWSKLKHENVFEIDLTAATNKWACDQNLNKYCTKIAISVTVPLIRSVIPHKPSCHQHPVSAIFIENRIYEMITHTPCLLIIPNFKHKYAYYLDLKRNIIYGKFVSIYY